MNWFKDYYLPTTEGPVINSVTPHVHVRKLLVQYLKCQCYFLDHCKGALSPKGQYLRSAKKNDLRSPGSSSFPASSSTAAVVTALCLSSTAQVPFQGRCHV